MNGFLKHPNLSHLLRLNPQKGSFWHEIWVFLNLIEVLIDRLKITEVFHITPYYDFSKSSFIEGESVFIRWHRPQPYGKNLQEKCEQYFPTYSMRTKDNKELHIWYQYWLTPVNKKGGVIDLAVALGKYEIKARERKAPTSHLDEVKMYVDNKYLWRLYKDNELFIYQPYDPPDILIECKDKSSGNRKSENQKIRKSIKIVCGNKSQKTYFDFE